MGSIPPSILSPKEKRSPFITLIYLGAESRQPGSWGLKTKSNYCKSRRGQILKTNRAHSVLERDKSHSNRLNWFPRKFFTFRKLLSGVLCWLYLLECRIIFFSIDVFLGDVTSKIEETSWNIRWVKRINLKKREYKIEKWGINL